MKSSILTLLFTFILFLGSTSGCVSVVKSEEEIVTQVASRDDAETENGNGEKYDIEDTVIQFNSEYLILEFTSVYPKSAVVPNGARLKRRFTFFLEKSIDEYGFTRGRGNKKEIIAQEDDQITYEIEAFADENRNRMITGQLVFDEEKIDIVSGSLELYSLGIIRVRMGTFHFKPRNNVKKED